MSAIPLGAPSRPPPTERGWERRVFAGGGFRHDVYEKGDGPGVIVVHEVPGITPEVEDFASHVVQRGFRVAMPSLFGEPGRQFTLPYVARQISRACVSREFDVLAKHASSPVTDFLRALGRDLFERCGGRGIGAIGMCLTGNIALGLVLEPFMLAPILAQPTLPFPLGPSAAAAVHATPEALATIRRRHASEGMRVLGLRFSNDPMCPKARFDTLRRELGDAFESIEVDSSLGNPHGILLRAHSVLTMDLVDREGHPTAVARDRVLAFLDERLREPERAARAE